MLVQQSNAQKDELEKLLNEELRLFNAVAGCIDEMKHEIDVDNALPVKQRYYFVSPVRMEIIHTKMSPEMAFFNLKSCLLDYIMLQQPFNGRCMKFFRKGWESILFANWMT